MNEYYKLNIVVVVVVLKNNDFGYKVDIGGDRETRQDNIGVYAKE